MVWNSFARKNTRRRSNNFATRDACNQRTLRIENFIGITETKLGRIDEANKDYETASTLDPKLAGPHTNLGFNYLSRKQYPLAEKQLRTALALDSTDAFAHYYLAVLYLTTERGKRSDSPP